MEEQKKKQWLVQVGTRVWNCRTQRGMSREKLAERLDITPQYVSDIEQGKKCMSMSIFVEMSQVLEVSMEFLAYGEQNPSPEVERLEQHLWNYDYAGGSNVIDVYIRYLRKKIDAGFDRKLIHTIRGAGYVIKEDS